MSDILLGFVLETVPQTPIVPEDLTGLFPEKESAAAPRNVGRGAMKTVNVTANVSVVAETDVGAVRERGRIEIAASAT